jgi:hypothetical protein
MVSEVYYHRQQGLEWDKIGREDMKIKMNDEADKIGNATQGIVDSAKTLNIDPLNKY